MSDDRYDEYLQRFSARPVRVTPFVSRAMGISMPDTALKLDAYTILCAPFRLSMGQASMLASVTDEETGFFGRFRGTLASLSLVRHPAHAPRPVKCFGRLAFAGISKIPGRDNFALFNFDWKPCPPAIVAMLGEYFDYVDGLRVVYDSGRIKPIRIDPASTHKLGFNNFSELVAGDAAIKLATYSMSAAELDFLAPPATPNLPMGYKAELRMYFQRYRFTVDATVVATSRTQTGVLKGKLALGFAPELVEILSMYHP